MTLIFKRDLDMVKMNPPEVISFES